VDFIRRFEIEENRFSVFSNAGAENSANWFFFQKIGFVKMGKKDKKNFLLNWEFLLPFIR